MSGIRLHLFTFFYFLNTSKESIQRYLLDINNFDLPQTFTMPTSGQPSTPLWVVTMLLFSISAEHAEARQITIKNSCSSTVWPGMHTGGTNPPSQATGWELAAGLSTTFSVDDAWTAGRIWARTGCVNQGGLFQCLTGACGSGANSGGINGDITWYVCILCALSIL